MSKLQKKKKLKTNAASQIPNTETRHLKPELPMTVHSRNSSLDLSLSLPYRTNGTPDAMSYFTTARILFSICK
jgi:hypothetical protein